MKDLLVVLLHLAVTVVQVCRPGGVRAVISENLLLKQQLVVLGRARRRAPNLRVGDQLLFGVLSLFLSPGRIRKVAIGLRPATLLAFHHALGRRKYRRLFSSSGRPTKPGPKGPSDALIRAIVELKSRNPRFGCPRIARMISLTFGVEIDKNVVYRVLATHYRPAARGRRGFRSSPTRPNSLWSVDLFRCESVVLRSYWVLVVMDQFTRRIVDLGVHRGAVAGSGLFRMFSEAIRGGVVRDISVPTTTRCSRITAGRQVFAYSTWTRSRPCLMSPCRIRLWNGRSARSGESFWTGCCSGMGTIWNGNSQIFRLTSTRHGVTPRWKVARRSPSRTEA